MSDDDTTTDRGSSPSDFDALYRGDLHPLQRDAAALPTRPLEEFVNVLRMWLDNLLPGAIVWGAPRVGKTEAIKYLLANIERLLSAPIPATLYSASEGDLPSATENRFYASVLDALDYGSPNAGTANVKRQRVIDFMIDRVRSAKEHRYLLFIDEAQWLSQQQYRHLMYMHNRLKTKDIRLITILVGSHEILDTKSRLRQEKQSHLLGRFMTASHHFEGILDLADFVRLLRAYDQHSEWPPGSQISFTQYFVPRAWDAGWRLETNAGTIWSVITVYRQRDNLPSKGELPMQALTALLRWILKTLHDRDRAELALDDALIELAYERVARMQVRNHFASSDTNKED